MVNALDALAYGLFCSAVQPSQDLDAVAIRSAASLTLIALGEAECEARVAYEYGERPDTAAARMCWAAAVVHDVFQPARSV